MLANDEADAVRLVWAKHPRAWAVEAYDADDGWDVYVYATERDHGECPEGEPWVRATRRYRVLLGANP